MTQEESSAASSRAQRCNVIDSLKFSFSSSSLVTAVTRSIRCVIASTAPAAALLFRPRPPGSAAALPRSASPLPAILASCERAGVGFFR